MNIHLEVVLLCVSLAAPVRSRTLPFEQPDCRTNKKMDDFYRFTVYPKEDDDGQLPGNWVCDLKFKDRLKVCVGIYRLMVNRRFDTSYSIKDEKDKALVNTECEERAVKYFIPGERNSTTNTQAVTTLNVNMFRCPISKLDIKFKFAWKIFAPKKYDFYVTYGYAPGAVTLFNDSPRKKNLCITNMFRPKSKS